MLTLFAPFHDSTEGDVGPVLSIFMRNLVMFSGECRVSAGEVIQKQYSVYSNVHHFLPFSDGCTRNMVRAYRIGR